MENSLEQRLRKGISYFRSKSPSDFNAADVVHLKLFLDLVDNYLREQQVKTAQTIFGEEEL